MATATCAEYLVNFGRGRLVSEICSRKDTRTHTHTDAQTYS